MSSTYRISAIAALAAILFVPSAAAQTPAPDSRRLIDGNTIADMRQWIERDIVHLSIHAQNERLAELSQQQIDGLDQQWRSEREQVDKPLIAATLSNPLSVYLARMQGRSLGLYAEIFVMDRHGLNVGQSTITSDFWQGDEAKFQKTFPAGKDGLFIDEAEWDDDMKIWRAQVSFTIADPQSGEPVGAATVEVNLTELERRAAAGI